MPSIAHPYPCRCWRRHSLIWEYIRASALTAPAFDICRKGNDHRTTELSTRRPGAKTRSRGAITVAPCACTWRKKTDRSVRWRHVLPLRILACSGCAQMIGNEIRLISSGSVVNTECRVTLHPYARPSAARECIVSTGAPAPLRSSLVGRSVRVSTFQPDIWDPTPLSTQLQAPRPV